MHMADGLVSPTVAGVMYALSALSAGFSLKKHQFDEETGKIAVMGLMGAFIFAAQMVNFTIPGTGSSGHLVGSFLLSVLLGPHAAFLTMIPVLMIQAFLFSDGGLLALGCNIWNMAFYGCFIGAMIVWRLMIRKGITPKKIVAASLLGSILTLQLGAFSVTLQTLASGITELPFVLFAGIMQPIHLAIGLIDGLITAAVLCFVFKARPEMLWTGTKKDSSNAVQNGQLMWKKNILVLAAGLILIGGGLSLVASSNPDGLEWSIQKIAGFSEIQRNEKVHILSREIQDKTALLPDYSVKNLESIFGKSFSGVLGIFVVITVCILGSYLFRFLKKKAK